MLQSAMVNHRKIEENGKMNLDLENPDPENIEEYEEFISWVNSARSPATKQNMLFNFKIQLLERGLPPDVADHYVNKWGRDYDYVTNRMRTRAKRNLKYNAIAGVNRIVRQRKWRRFKKRVGKATKSVISALFNPRSKRRYSEKDLVSDVDMKKREKQQVFRYDERDLV